MSILLSVIIPIYNVEEFVRSSLESILNQGIDESSCEIILVNDGSTDNSMAMIQDIVDAHANIRIINQENQGLSVTRNNGLSVAKGEYILMHDSDDLLIPGSLKPLLDKALETKADLVVADFLKKSNEEIAELKLDEIVQPEIVVKEKLGKELFMEDLDPYTCYVWRTLYRKTFLIENSLSFVPGIFFQDIPFTHECFMKAKKSIRTTRKLNIYRVNRRGAATHSFSPHKAKSFSIAIAKTWKLRQLEGISSDMRYKLEEDMYISFRMMLYRTLYCVHNRADRNKIMDILNENTLKIFFTHSIKQRLFTALVKWFPHLFINFYYKYAQIAFKK